MVYKFKDQYMNRSAFCEIKNIKRLVLFSQAGYMIWVGFKIMTRTPLATLPRFPPTPPSLKLFTFCQCKLSAIIFLLQVVFIMLNG